ncbi:UNVERIFIED_ORG: hypothetical protein GGD59_003690 [Rhizobium esperanzae]|uniref:hypothetical protein n=1 Tax=Rhizobium phaseoli TaxID=396 RepID=UPI000F877A87|nr:hypothetical protein [Rhizobium phaseoli]
MNSSIIMFSNMFSDRPFYKHYKRQSLLQRTRRVDRWQRVRPNLFRKIREISAAGVPIGRNLASLRSGPQDMDLDAAPVFPGGFKLGLASAGLFLVRRQPVVSGIFRPTARFGLSGLMQRAYSANARRRSRASRGRPSDRLLPVSLPRRPFAL